MNFVVEDYFRLDNSARQLVDQWLLKYNLMDRVTIIEQVSEEGSGSIDDAIKIIAWGYPFYAVYKEPTEIPIPLYVLSSNEDGMTIGIIAEFHYDDFPWEVLDTK